MDIFGHYEDVFLCVIYVEPPSIRWDIANPLFITHAITVNVLILTFVTLPHLHVGSGRDSNLFQARDQCLLAILNVKMLFTGFLISVSSLCNWSLFLKLVVPMDGTKHGCFLAKMIAITDNIDNRW